MSTWWQRPFQICLFFFFTEIQIQNYTLSRLVDRLWHRNFYFCNVLVFWTFKTSPLLPVFQSVIPWKGGRISFSRAQIDLSGKKPTPPIQILARGPNFLGFSHFKTLKGSTENLSCHPVNMLMHLFDLTYSNIDFYTKCILNIDPLLPNKPKSYNR